MIAVEYGDPDANIWLLDQTNDEMVRLTEQALDSSPVWSPDGKYIAIDTHEGPNQSGVKIKSVGVGMSEIPVLESGVDVGVTAWSPDGKDLLLAKDNGPKLEMSYVDWHSRSETSYLTLRSHPSGTVFSPDGHWVALGSTETGTMEVYVVSFPNPTKRYRVSMAGGGCPVWRRDGRELFFLGPDNTLYVAAITPEGSDIKIGPSHALFRADVHVEGQPFDIDQTGTKFLLVLNTPRKHSDIMLLRNWVR
jgi:Tol biopolymer transport system component